MIEIPIPTSLLLSRSTVSPYVVRYYLVGVIEEVNGHAERQGVMIGIPQQDGQDLHTGWPGLPLALLLGPLHRALAVDGILTHLSPENSSNTVVYKWYEHQAQ